jgi:hypothetical protein
MKIPDPKFVKGDFVILKEDMRIYRISTGSFDAGLEPHPTDEWTYDINALKLDRFDGISENFRDNKCCVSEAELVPLGRIVELNEVQQEG